MKLSQFETDRAADIICDITIYVNDILADPRLKARIDELAGDKKPEIKTYAQRIEFGVSVINDLIPYLLKEKKEAVFGIIAAVNEKTVEEIKEQKFGETCRQIKECVQDKELMELFQ